MCLQSCLSAHPVPTTTTMATAYLHAGKGGERQGQINQSASKQLLANTVYTGGEWLHHLDEQLLHSVGDTTLIEGPAALCALIQDSTPLHQESSMYAAKLVGR